MTQFSIYLDEDSDAHGLADGLRAAGIDVLRSGDASMDGRSDAEQFAFAVSVGRVLCTRNTRDFRVLHFEYLNSGRSHAGLIISSPDLSIGEQVRRIVRLWTERSAEAMADSEEFLSQWGPART
ncbi:MAG: DUF5615 family PIN-like protein [Dehalococcoidia bacterium]